MRLPALSAAAFLLSACALGTGRVESLSRAPSFRAKVLAVAPARGQGPMRGKLARAVAGRLTAGGLRAVDLETADSVLAGSALGLDVAANPRVLAEIRGSTGADAVVFLTADPGWRSLDVQVLAASTGDSVLRATVRPRGPEFESADEAASAAAEALSALAVERERAKSAAVEASDEIPVP